MKNVNIEWQDYNCKHGDGLVANIKSGKHEYELWAYRMDDEHLRMYPSNASGYKYYWSIFTTETFYDGGDGTVLIDGYTMTLDEAKEAMEGALAQRNKYRKEWREDAKASKLKA